MDELTRSLAGIVTAIIGLAILSVIVSNKANTTGVIQAASSGLSNTLAVATAPITGASVTPNMSYPTNTGSSSIGGVGSLGTFGGFPINSY